jgi:hypothetical protein
LASEEWKIILQSEVGGASGEAAGGGGAGGAGGQGETPNQRKNLFEDAGKVFSAIASTAGMLAILIRSIGGSTVASTFMEVIFKILGALWDLFLINFLPIFMVLVKWLLSLMPIVKELGESLKPLIELIADKLGGLLNAVTEWIVPRLLEFAKALTAFATTGDISPLLAWGEKFFKDLFELASKLFMDFITWVKETGPEIVESIGKSVTLFANWLQEKGPTIMNTIVSGIKIMQDTLNPLFTQLVAILGPIFEEIFKPITDKAKEYWEWLKITFKVIWDGLIDYLKGVWAVISAYIKDEITWLMSLMGTLFGTALSNWWHFMTGDKNGSGAAAIAQAIANAPPHPVMGVLPDMNKAIQEIKSKIPAIPALVSVGDSTITAIKEMDKNNQAANAKVEAAVSGSYSSTGGQRISRYSWEGIHATSTNCGAGESISQSSNQNQTNNVMYLARKKIYEELTGKQYMGS